jgi:hypothetical protein
MTSARATACLFGQSIMFRPAPISAAIRGSVKRTFPPDASARVLELLASVSQHVRVAILVLADGDESIVRALVKLAAVDNRDVLKRLHDMIGDDVVQLCHQLQLPVPWPWSTTTDEYVAERVKDYVASRLIVRVDQLQPNTCLQTDLGVNGTEAERFMRDFALKFRVDMTGFDPRRHFSPAPGEKPLHDLWGLLTRRTRELVPISIGALIESAQRHRWSL